eukprot:scaffold1469_cov119-Cylindrotheca_fusiformis.AAC.25
MDARSFNGRIQVSRFIALSQIEGLTVRITQVPCCKLQYRLRAQLGESLVERVFNVISAPLPSDVVPCMVKPQTHELKRLGVLNKGCLSVGASVENSRIGRGQAIRISIASRNDTSLDIVRVQLKLVELIEYRAQDEDDTTKIQLEKLKDIDLPSLEKERRSGSNLKYKKDGFAKKMESTYRAIYKDLVSSRSQIDLVVPNTARDSYNGNLLTISHYVKVTFFTKAMIENPSLKLPVVIGNARETERDRRPTNTPLTTVLVDEEIPEEPEDACDESTITVGTAAGDIPVADAVFLDEDETNNLFGNVSPYPAQSMEASGRKQDSAHAASSRVAPMPSAPDEAILRDHRPTRFGSHVRDFDGRSIDREVVPMAPPTPDSPQSSDSSNGNYSPYRMYTSQVRRPMPAEYNYEDSDISTFQESEDERTPARWSNSRQPLSLLEPNIAQGDQKRLTKKSHPSRDAESRHQLNRLIHELCGSIHDYEVVVAYARHPEYRALFPTLSPIELGIIMSHVNMNHQVKVARLVARQMAYAQAFTCDHCAEVVKRTSEYFRPNMVETLLPFCEDLTTNRRVIQQSLSEWEQLITDRLFDGLYEC